MFSRDKSVAVAVAVHKYVVGDGLYLMLTELVAQPLCTKKTIKYV